ncbi:MAG: HesA/MoeB/ThiF family protein [Bradymonadales bacterium]|nr:HesA/MoeB/ThiF family protein [Bradymonadales bacterium]
MINIDRDWLEHHSRQIRFPSIGLEGQQTLSRSSVLLVGCGGLGTIIATHLVRGGIGQIRIVDGDTVQNHNLHRQILYDARDVASQQPKALVAAEKLRAIDSGTSIEPHPVRLERHNVLELIQGVTLVLDGTDNFPTRYLINDACVMLGIPWIYAGVVGSAGMTLNILPPDGPCFRCLFPDPPQEPFNADTHGIVNCLPAILASIQVAEAYKILIGSAEVRRTLLHVDIWSNDFRQLEVQREPSCVCCGQRRFETLQGDR